MGRHEVKQRHNPTINSVAIKLPNTSCVALNALPTSMGTNNVKSSKDPKKAIMAKGRDDLAVAVLLLLLGLSVVVGLVVVTSLVLPIVVRVISSVLKFSGGITIQLTGGRHEVLM